MCVFAHYESYAQTNDDEPDLIHAMCHDATGVNRGVLLMKVLQSLNIQCQDSPHESVLLCICTTGYPGTIHLDFI